MAKGTITAAEPSGAMARKLAFQLIIIFGVVSFFGDIVYEGARGVNGAYLETIGANAAAVGIIAGLGEFLGYVIRLVSGYVSDKTRTHWVFVFVGYGMLITVPLLALTGVWQVAAVLMVLERLGKALRSPAKDTLLSQATKQVGTGLGFGLHQLMDRLGAIVGSLYFSIIFFFNRDASGVPVYQRGYAWLLIPFALIMISVVFAFIKVPNPDKLEAAASPTAKKEPDKLTKLFWLYTLFSFVTTLGYVNFTILGFHFKASGVFTDSEIPLFYAIAMGVVAASCMIIGKLYDVLKARTDNRKGGLLTLIVIPIATVFIPLLGFSPNKTVVIASVVLWGFVLGTHDTIMKSSIADLTPMRKRGTGYGIFNTAYGLAILAGSSLMGVVYDISIPALMIGAAAVQAVALPLFFVMRREAVRVE